MAEEADIFDEAVKVSRNTTALLRLQKIVNCVSSSQDRVLFDMVGPLARHLRQNPSLLSMLLAIADSGALFDVEEWGDVVEQVEQEGPEDGAGDEGMESSTGEERFSDDDKESTTSSHLPSLYLRRISGTVEELSSWSKHFVKAFPYWEAEELAHQMRLEKLPATAMASRSYPGISSLKKGWERDREDLQSKNPTRYSSFILSNQLQDRVEHFQIKLEGEEWFVRQGAAGLRESVIIQEIEEVIIAVLGVWRLNSSFGRLRSSYLPSAIDTAIRDSIDSIINVASSPLPLSHFDLPAHSGYLPRPISAPTPILPSHSPLLFPSECQAVKEAKTSLLQKHSLDLNQVLSSEQQGVSPEFLRIWLFNSTTFEISPRGFVESAVHGLSDVTREELDVSSRVEFHNGGSGNAAFSDKQLQGLARNISSSFVVSSSLSSPILKEQSTTAAGIALDDQAGYPSPVSSASTLIAQQYGCFLDLFGMSTDHRDVRRALYYWLRHLRILGSRIVSLNSSQVSAS